MKNRLATLVGALALSATAAAQTWIWYPGDYEIWLGNQMNNRRTERGAFFPPFWKTDSHYVVVEFSKKLDLAEPEEIFIAAEGKYNVKLDGKLQFGMPSTLKLPAGKHNLNIKVWNQSTPPTIYVKGKTVNTDNTWKVTYEDKEWIDESGKASTTWNFQLKLCITWTTVLHTRIMVPAFIIYAFPLASIESTARFRLGILYSGSSIIKNDFLNLYPVTLFTSNAPKKINTIPTRYMAGPTHRASEKNAPANRAITGSFAPQGIKGVSIAVALRSLSLRMVPVGQV